MGIFTEEQSKYSKVLQRKVRVACKRECKSVDMCRVQRCSVTNRADDWTGKVSCKRIGIEVS
jgi:hypothetical protein